VWFQSVRAQREAEKKKEGWVLHYLEDSGRLPPLQAAPNILRSHRGKPNREETHHCPAGRERERVNEEKRRKEGGLTMSVWFTLALAWIKRLKQLATPQEATIRQVYPHCSEQREKKQMREGKGDSKRRDIVC
jgi:hypothetical protein